MDIIASILAYVVCMTGLVTGLVMSFVVFFSAPGGQPGAPTQAVAMAAKPSASDMATVLPVDEKASKILPVKTVARVRIMAPSAPVALDAQQKLLLTPHRMHQLAERERERHVAFREQSSFEKRFLGYDD